MTIKLGLLGFGTVASGIPFLLKENKEKIQAGVNDSLEIAKVLVRGESEKERLLAAGHPYQFVTTIEEIIDDPEITIVVELMGRIEPAKTYITRALKAGKHVVSANKDLIASHGEELVQLAQSQGLAFYYEAAVAGGIPILRTLANSLISDKITRILGVLNGTSNFMLTKMVDEGWSYDKALQTAQELGYAESDPTNDVAGIDAAYKVVILSQFGFGMTIQLSDVEHKGITEIGTDDVALAQQLGYVIKLVGSIEETPSGIYAEVGPTFVPKSHPLATVNDVMNAVFVESIGIGSSMYYGPGAGQKPTATSVVTDIIRIARRLKDKTVGKPFNDYRRPTKLADLADVKSCYCLTIEGPTGKDVLSRIGAIFEQLGISFDQVRQDQTDDLRMRFAILTHEISKEALMVVLEALASESDFRVLNTFKVLGE